MLKPVIAATVLQGALLKIPGDMTPKQRESQGKDWKSLVRDMVLTRVAGGDYTDLHAEAPPAEIEESDD